MINRKTPLKRKAKPLQNVKKSSKAIQKKSSKVSKKVDKLKPIPKLIKDAQQVFNKYIRTRDSENGWFTCISCGQTLTIDKMNAGHYAPVKSSSALRFNEYNVNGECAWSNGFDEFHLIGYRKNLINKIGLEMVEWLDNNARARKNWTRSELEEIIVKYKI
jgi:hypothetical protein